MNNLNKLPAKLYTMDPLNYRSGVTLSVSGPSGVSLAEDTTVTSPFDGGSTLKWATIDGATNYANILFDTEQTLHTNFGVLIKSNVSHVFPNLYLKNAASGTLYLIYSAASYVGKMGEEWRLIMLPPQVRTRYAGAPDWGNKAGAQGLGVYKLMFTLTAAQLTTDVDIWIGGIVTKESPKAKVAISLDDFPASVLETAYPLMAAKGFKGVVAQTDATPGSVADALVLQKAGWDVINHTSTHPSGASLTDSQIITEFAGHKKTMRDNGLTRGLDFAAYPGTTLKGASTEAATLLDSLFSMGRGAASRMSVYGGASGFPASSVYNNTYNSMLPNDMLNLAHAAVNLGSNTDYDISDVIYAAFTATPASTTLDCTNSLTVGDMVRFSSTGALPAPLVAGRNYWVYSSTATTLTVRYGRSEDTAITMTDAGTGAHSIHQTGVKDLLDEAGWNGGTLILYGHAFIDVPTLPAYENSTDWLVALLNDLSAREEAGTAEVVTFTDIYNDIFSVSRAIDTVGLTDAALDDVAAKILLNPESPIKTDANGRVSSTNIIYEAE